MSQPSNTQTHRTCPRCRTSSYANSKAVRLLITECGHSLCSNCLEVLFAQRASGNCHVCKRTVKKNGYWEQTFDDPLVEKEIFWRKKLRRILNLHEGDFPDLRSYNDYLEKLESLVFNLTNDIDVDSTKNELDILVREHETTTAQNRNRKSADELWIQQQLYEEQLFRHRLADYNKQDSIGASGADESSLQDAEQDAKGLIEELKSSDLPAELILDQRRKRKIEADLAAREANKKAKLAAAESKLKVSFSGQSRRGDLGSSAILQDQGQPYRYTPVDIHLVVVTTPPTINELNDVGFLKHMRQPSSEQAAGGYRAEYGCLRALLEARCDILAGIG